MASHESFPPHQQVVHTTQLIAHQSFHTTHIRPTTFDQSTESGAVPARPCQLTTVREITTKNLCNCATTGVQQRRTLTSNLHFVRPLLERRGNCTRAKLFCAEPRRTHNVGGLLLRIFARDVVGNPIRELCRSCHQEDLFAKERQQKSQLWRSPKQAECDDLGHDEN